MVLVVAGRAAQRLEASARLGTSERTVERVDRMDRGRCGRGGAGVFAEGRVHLLQGWRMLQMETESARAELITTCLVVPWCRARGRDENMRTMTGYKGVGPGPGEAMGRRRGPRAMTKVAEPMGHPHSNIPVSQCRPLPGLDDTNGSRPGTGGLRRVRRVCPGWKPASLRLGRRSTNCFRSPRPPFLPLTLCGTPPCHPRDGDDFDEAKHP